MRMYLIFFVSILACCNHKNFFWNSTGTLSKDNQCKWLSAIISKPILLVSIAWCIIHCCTVHTVSLKQGTRVVLGLLMFVNVISFLFHRHSDAPFPPGIIRSKAMISIWNFKFKFLCWLAKWTSFAGYYASIIGILCGIIWNIPT